MLTIKSKPILEYKIDLLPADITEIIFVVNYKKEQIIDYFGNFLNGRKITYVVQENLNGTGGAINLLKNVADEKFAVMMGDDLYHKNDIEDILKYELAILIHEAEYPSKFGAIKIDGGGNLIDVIEKTENPENNLVNTGLYMLNRKFFDYDLVPIGNREFGLPQTLAKMAKDHNIKVLKARFW